MGFDTAIREALETIFGAQIGRRQRRLSPGGINLHIPAALLASDQSSTRALVERIREYELGPSRQSDSTLAALSTAMARSDWQVVGNVDVPLKQHALSVAIDEVMHQHFLYRDSYGFCIYPHTLTNSVFPFCLS